MAASCGSASGALPLRPEQGIPENYRKPLSRSRAAEDHDKDQPFAAHPDGTSALVLVITFHEAGKIIDKSFLAIVRTIVPAAAGSLIMPSLVLLLQQLISHLPSALVLVLSIGEVRRLIGV